MDTTIHINVADIPPEVGESFGGIQKIHRPAREPREAGSPNGCPQGSQRKGV